MISLIDAAMLAAASSPLVSITVKATLILAFALLGVRLARRRRASIRHAILAAAFGILLMLPFASTLAPPLRIALPAAAQDRIEPTLLDTAINTPPPVVTPYAGEDAAIPPSHELSPSTLLLGLWLVGTGLFLLPVVMGLWQIRSLRRSGLPWLRGETITEGLTRGAGIHRRIEVLLHDSVAGPMTCGVRHPAIVFPPDAPDWPEDDLNRAIVHELEHVWRRDWIWHCLARTVCAVYWFHPLVWIAARRLTVEAERACDDAVLGRSDATAYADQLIELARRLSAARKSPALAMANRSDLSTRIGALLDAQQRRGRAGRMLLALAGVAAVIGVAMSPLRIIAAQNTGKFEVASIRLEDPHDPRSAPANTNSPEFRSQMTVFPSNRLTMRHTLLRSLICDAFGVDYNYVRGGPDWLDHQSYDLNAKVDGNARLTKEQMRPLLRNLLEERFHLKAHQERKIVPGYALTIAKNGPRLQPNKGAPFIGMDGGYTFKWQNVSVEYFAKMLERKAKGPVIDRTGIKGMYDFDLKFGPHESDDPVFAHIQEGLYAGLPDIFTVLQEQLGLRLVPEKVAVDTLVIDRIDRVPVEN